MKMFWLLFELFVVFPLLFELFRLIPGGGTAAHRDGIGGDDGLLLVALVAGCALLLCTISANWGVLGLPNSAMTIFRIVFSWKYSLLMA